MDGSTKVGSIHYDLDLDDKDFNKKASNASNTVSGLAGSFKSAEAGSLAFAGALAAAGIAAAGAATFGIKMAADLETMTQGFVTLLGSTKKADDAIAMIKKDAASTPFELAGLINSNQLLTSVTGNSQQSERMLLNVGKALTAMGKGQPELDRIIVNLQQIGAVGKASAIDIKQFAFAGIPIYKMLTDATGKTGAALEDMITNGQITFDMLEKMFNKAGEGTGRFAKAFELQGGTFNQVMSNFKDNISITLSELVKSLGIFDLAKQALSGLTAAVGQLAQPQTIAAIKEFLISMQQYLPIIIGFIAGGLTPAFIAAAAGAWALISPLLPFLAIGAAIGLVVKLIVDQFGGWQNVLTQVMPIVQTLGYFFQQILFPILQEIWNVISAQLIPALSQLYQVLAPVLIPVLKVLGAALIGVVLAAITGVSIALLGLVVILTNIVKFITWFIDNTINLFQYLYNVLIGHSIIPDLVNGITSWFSKLPNMITNALSGLVSALTKPFNDAWSSISQTADKIKNKLNDINPFTRHSPSLVDNVTRGVAEIRKQYESLATLSFQSPSAMLDMTDSAFNQAKVLKQDIAVNVGQMGNNLDLQSVGRELGFKASIMPSF